MLTRSHRSVEELVGGLCTRSGCETAPEIVEELSTPLPGKHPAVLRGSEFPQTVDVQIGGVVEIGHARHPVGMLFEGGGEVEQVAAVAPHLFGGVKPLPHAFQDAHVIRTVEHERTGPLLELHDDVRRRASPGMVAAEYDVCALARHRQLVLNEGFHPLQAGLDEIGREHLKAARPRADLPL